MIIQKNTRHFLIALSLLCVVACKSTEKQVADTTDKTEVVAKESTAYKALAEKWGGEVKYDFNEDRSLVLAQSVPPANAKELTFSYFVFDMKTEAVRTQGTIFRGSVKWLSLKEIEVFNAPGKMAPGVTPDDLMMVINVFTGEHTPKKDWNK